LLLETDSVCCCVRLLLTAAEDCNGVLLLKFDTADACITSLVISGVKGLAGFETNGVLVMVSNLALFCSEVSGRFVCSKFERDVSHGVVAGDTEFIWTGAGSASAFLTATAGDGCVADVVTVVTA
jgi:hypothetical protein